MVRKVLEDKIVSVPEVKEILTNLGNTIGREAFDSFQDATLSYAETFAKVDSKKAEKIKKMLIKEYKVGVEHAVMVVNIMPVTVEELRTIFEKNPKTAKFTNDKLQEIVYKIQDIAK